MISKELLSEVLGENIIIVMDKETTPRHLDTKNKLTYFNANNFVNQINIYELTHKCKEWAIGESYYLKSGFNSDNTIDPVCDKFESDIYKLVFKDGRPCENHIALITGESEYESIFKACEWILKHKETA